MSPFELIEPRSLRKAAALLEAQDATTRVLGGGTASRLFQEVREERGLAYSVYSAVSTNVDCGMLTAYAATSPAKVPEVVEITERIVAELVADGITEAERALALGFLEGSLELAQEDTGSRMARIGRSEQTRSEVLTLDEHLAKLHPEVAANCALADSTSESSAA